MGSKVLQEQRFLFFKDELKVIYNDDIRNFVKLCLMLAPSYFFKDCPASSSGKYHPIDELGWDGTIVHTKRVVAVATILCVGLACDDHRDEIVAACIIHDLRKQGLNKTGHTKKNHPALAAALVDEVYKDTGIISEDSYKIIRGGVGYHYGPWSIKPWVKPLPLYTPEELCVYLSDYIASKPAINVEDITNAE